MAEEDTASERRRPWTPTVRAIYHRMRARNLTQRSLALKAGLAETYVRDLFRGRSRNPNQQALQSLADALECPITDLLNPPEAVLRERIGEVNNNTDEFLVLRWLWHEFTPQERRAMIGLAMDLYRARKDPDDDGSGADDPRPLTGTHDGHV